MVRRIARDDCRYFVCVVEALFIEQGLDRCLDAREYRRKLGVDDRVVRIRLQDTAVIVQRTLRFREYEDVCARCDLAFRRSASTLVTASSGSGANSADASSDSASVAADSVSGPGWLDTVHAGSVGPETGSLSGRTTLLRRLPGRRLSGRATVAESFFQQELSFMRSHFGRPGYPRFRFHWRPTCESD